MAVFNRWKVIANFYFTICIFWFIWVLGLNIIKIFVVIISWYYFDLLLALLLLYYFFLSGFSSTDTDDSQDSRGREGTIFYSTLPLPPAHEHWDIYLQLCMWDDYHVFLIATLVFTRLLLDEIYHLIDTLSTLDLSRSTLFVQRIVKPFFTCFGIY